MEKKEENNDLRERLEPKFDEDMMDQDELIQHSNIPNEYL